MTNVQMSRIQASFGKRIASRLDESAALLPHDINERLRIARTQALARRKVVKLEAASGVSVTGGVGVLQGKDSPFGWWKNQFASWLPLIALLAGLIGIGVVQEDKLVLEIAEVDAELLIDELPPAAYTDPGFAQFLRVNQSN